MNVSGSGVKTTTLIKNCKIIATSKYAPNCLNFGLWVTNAYRNKGKLEENDFFHIIFFQCYEWTPYYIAYTNLSISEKSLLWKVFDLIVL